MHKPRKENCTNLQQTHSKFVMALLILLGMIPTIKAQLPKSLSCEKRGFDEPSGCGGLGWNYDIPPLDGSPSYCYCTDYHCSVLRSSECCKDYCAYCANESPTMCFGKITIVY